jgi:hypothetical protein
MARKCQFFVQWGSIPVCGCDWAVVLYIEGAHQIFQAADLATLAGDTECRGSGSICLQRMPSAVRLLRALRPAR